MNSESEWLCEQSERLDVHLGDARHRARARGFGGPEDLRDVVALLVVIVIALGAASVRVVRPRPVPDAVGVGAAAAHRRSRRRSLGSKRDDRGQVAGDPHAVRGLRAAQVLEILDIILHHRRDRCRRRCHRVAATHRRSREVNWWGWGKSAPPRALATASVEPRASVKKSTVEQFWFSKRVSKRFSLTRFRSLPS